MEINTKESGQFMGHAACDVCGSQDNQGIYQAKDGTFNGHCFGCEANKQYGDSPPELVKKASTSTATKTIEDYAHIAEYPCLEHRDRFVTKNVVSLYGVKSEVVGGKETTRYYPYYKDSALVGYKVRSLPKKFRAVGSISGNIQLFGQQLFEGGRLLIITAGEDDAIASYRMTERIRNNKGRQKGYPSVSLPRGAKDMQAIKDNLEWIEGFETVVFAVDQEEGDIAAAKKMIGLLTPGKGKIAKFSLNDASDMCQNRKFTEFYDSVWSALSHAPNGILEGADAIWEAFQKREEFTPIAYPTDWGLEKCPGLYFPALITLIAGTGVGKSSIIRELQLHMFNSTNYNIGLVTMEDSITTCVGTLIGMHMEKRVMTPDVEIPEDELRQANDALFQGDRFVFCDSTGIRSDTDLFSKIRFMAKSRDCKVVFLDHLTAILDRLGVKSDKGQVQYTDSLVASLNELVQELEICIVLAAHVRKTSSGSVTDKTYETGGVPTEDSIKGSGSIKQYSYQTIAITRDKSDEEAPTFLYVLKDRLVGWTGRSKPLFFNYDTGRYEPFQGVINDDEVF